MHFAIDFSKINKHKVLCNISMCMCVCKSYQIFRHFCEILHFCNAFKTNDFNKSPNSVKLLY